MHAWKRLSLAAVVVLSGCGVDKVLDAEELAPTGSSEQVDALSAEIRQGAPQFEQHFQAAAREFHVPVEFLKSIGFVETRWQMVRGEEEFEGVPAAFGVMALRGERLLEGASRAGVTVEAARSDALSNIRTAAALLASYAQELGVSGTSDLGAWAPVAARYSGIAAPEGQAAYVHKDVYDVMRRGGMISADVQPKFQEPVSVMVAGPDYAAAIWRPSVHFEARPTGAIGDPAMIIIHTCEGAYSSCWPYLTNNDRGVSAHYVVNESGTEISQLVREADLAHHIGATYDCTLNSSVECWRNTNACNYFTVGIEHGGYASQTSWPVGQIDSSSKLACDISRGQAIPRDRYHIVGHGQLQPYNRSDPGPNWPWTTYINKVNQWCATGLIIDTNNYNNDTSKGYVRVSANWTLSSNVPGYFGNGYYWAPTEAISDAAEFYFYLPAAATKTIDAWWTAGTDRSTTAPFVAFNAAGTRLATVNVNQQVNGGKWNTLGTWSFSAGWNKVVLSRWTTAGSVVIADAVRVR